MTIPSPQSVAEAAKRTRAAAVLRRKISVGWVLLVTSVIFICFALITYSVKHNFDADSDRAAKARHDDCIAANRRRADAQTVAEADVDSDRQIWQAINDLVPNGLPEPAHTIIFSGLDDRLTRILSTYKRTECPPASGDSAG